MLCDQSVWNICVPPGNKIGDILESEINKKTDPCAILVSPSSADQKQGALYKVPPKCPLAIILKPKKPAHYKMFSKPERKYLYLERCIPLQVAIINKRPGLELSVILRYKALTHQHEAVQVCHEHSNITPAESKGMDLRTPNKAAFVLRAGYSRRVKYELEGLHPMARVTLNADAEKEVMNLVFACYSSCKPHKNCGNLMLLHLNIRDINTRGIVSSSEWTVRVAANVLARASMKYEEDMLGKTTPRRPPKRPMPSQGSEGLDNAAEVVNIVSKHLKRGHGDEKKDDVVDSELNQGGGERDNVSGLMDIVVKDSELNQGGGERDNASGVRDIVVYHSELNQDGGEQDNASGVRDIVEDHSEVNQNLEGCDDTPDVVEVADFLINSKRSNKDLFKRMMANIEAEVSMAPTDRLPIQIENNQSSMDPTANNSALTVANQNKTSPEGNSLTSSTSLDSSKNRTVSLQEHHAVSDAAGFIVTGLKNPESDCHKIKQYIRSLGASCSQGSVCVPHNRG